MRQLFFSSFYSIMLWSVKCHLASNKKVTSLMHFAPININTWQLETVLKKRQFVCFYWHLICKTRYSKMVKNKNMPFFMENLKKSRKGTKNFLTFRSRDSNPRFSVIFPPMIWILIEDEGDDIKSKQASKRDMTLKSA